MTYSTTRHASVEYFATQGNEPCSVFCGIATHGGFVNSVGYCSLLLLYGGMVSVRVSQPRQVSSWHLHRALKLNSAKCKYIHMTLTDSLSWRDAAGETWADHSHLETCCIWTMLPQRSVLGWVAVWPATIQILSLWFCFVFSPFYTQNVISGKYPFSFTHSYHFQTYFKVLAVWNNWKWLLKNI